MGTSQYSKKDYEKILFDRFVMLKGDLPAGTVEQTEEPDFLLHCANEGGSLGIELTALHWAATGKDQPAQAREAMLRRIAEMARDRYAATAQPSVTVSIHFSPFFNPTKAISSSLAESIAKVVQRNLPPMDETTNEEYTWDNRDYFPEEVNSLSVSRFTGHKEIFFSAPQAAFIPQLMRTDLERAITPKEAKVAAYRKKADEVWLVVTCDGGGLSGSYDFDEAMLNPAFVSGFDRIFLMRSLAARVHELLVRKATAAAE